MQMFDLVIMGVMVVCGTTILIFLTAVTYKPGVRLFTLTNCIGIAIGGLWMPYLDVMGEKLGWWIMADSISRPQWLLGAIYGSAGVVALAWITLFFRIAWWELKRVKSL